MITIHFVYNYKAFNGRLIWPLCVFKLACALYVVETNI